MMCPPFVVDMDAVEGNDKVCGITAFLTTAYAILPQMSRSYVVFGKVRTLPFTTYIFIEALGECPDTKSKEKGITSFLRGITLSFFSL